MGLGVGSKSWVSIIEEVMGASSPYGAGTAGLWTGARASYLRLVRDEMESNENTFQSPALGTRAVSAMYQGSREVGGPMEFEIGYEGGLLYLLKHVLGGYDYTVDGGGVAGYHKHVFTPKEDLPAGMSMELCMAGIPTTAKVVRYPGVKVNTLELALEQNGILTCTVELIAYNEDHNSGAGHTPVDAVYPVFTTLKPIKFWHQVGTASLIVVSGTTLSSTTGSVRSWRFKVDNKLERRFNLSRFTAEPFQNDKREISFDCTAEFTDLALYNKYQAATEGAFSVNLSSKDEAVYVTGTSPYRLDLSGAAQRLTGSRPKISDAGIVTVDFASRLLGASEVSVTMYNGQTVAGVEI